MRLRDLNESLTATIYFHGTSFEDKAEKIMDVGFLKGAEIQGRKRLSPIQNRVYLTENLHYAVIYLLGGEYQGVNVSKKTFNGGDNGYLFLVKPSDLNNPLPDEDSVGEYLYKWSRNNSEREYEDRVALDFIRRNVTLNQYERMMDGDYTSWAMGGKRALKNMPKDVAQTIINRGGHISNEGNIKPYEAWRFSKKRAGELNSKSSNFFDLAIKVWSQ